MSQNAAPSSISTIPMGNLTPGSQGLITDIADHETSDRLREMGFAEGLLIHVQHESFLGRDPIVVQVGQMIVALRREDANLILIGEAE